MSRCCYGYSLFSARVVLKFVFEMLFFILLFTTTFIVVIVCCKVLGKICTLKKNAKFELCCLRIILARNSENVKYFMVGIFE